MQHDLGTGRDMNSKHGVKGVGMHAMGFPSSHCLLGLQIPTEQELRGIPFHVSTESKPFSR